MKKFLAGAAIALSVVAVPAQAGEVLLNFSSTAGTNAGNDDLRWTVTGQDAFKVTASAWTLSSWKQGNTNYSKIYDSDLGQWTNGNPGGLGVVNDFNEGGSPSHTIDNGSDTKNGITYKNTDFIVFQFDKAVNISSLYLDAYGDTDFSFAYGNLASVPNWNGTNYTNSSFNGLTFVHKPQAGNATSDGWRATSSNIYATTWVVSALFPTATAPDKNIDAFKLSAMKVNVTAAVPEPATWAMMILGFGVIGGVMRRRKGQIDNGALRLA